MYMGKTANVRKKVLLVSAMLLLGTSVMCACGKERNEEIGQKTFGIDIMQELSVQSPEQIVCGRDGVWVINAHKNAPIRYLAYETQTARGEMSEWQQEKTVEWQEEEGENLLNIAEQDGTLYAEILGVDGNSIMIRKHTADGRWNDVMETAAADDNWCSVGSGLFVDDNENIYLASGNTVTCFGKEGEKVCAYALKGSACFFQGQNGQYVECAAVDGRTISLYELQEKGAVEKWTLDVPARCAYGIICSETGMLCLATGEELLFIDRTDGELLARSNFVMMGVPSVMAGKYDAAEETLRLYGADDTHAGNLFYGLLSERDAAAQRTELVYGTMGSMNGEAAISMQAAIREFNRENENYYVTIRNYHNDTYGGDTHWQRLHTDMASGNAPDIIEMEDTLMYYESYVRNGYLEDLSPYLQQSEYGKDIMWNVLNVYEMDGGLYLLAPHFELETFQVNPEYEIDIEEWNMETFLELIEENRWEKDILTAGTPQLLLYYLIVGQQDRFIDWERKTATFETEEFREILALCGEYAAQNRSDTAGWSYAEMKRNSLCTAGFLFSYGDYLADADTFGRKYPLYGYPTSSGQTYRIGACSDGCVMYAGSKNKEGAWEFMESLLGEAHQKWQNAYDFGFPIRESMLRELRAEEVSLMVDGEKMTMAESELQIVDNVLQNGKFTRALINRGIWVIIEEESAACFAGDKSAEEVAHIIQGRVEMLLNE